MDSAIFLFFFDALVARIDPSFCATHDLIAGVLKVAVKATLSPGSTTLTGVLCDGAQGNFTHVSLTTKTTEADSYSHSMPCFSDVQALSEWAPM